MVAVWIICISREIANKSFVHGLIVKPTTSVLGKKTISPIVEML
jgi:hypothetical protein